MQVNHTIPYSLSTPATKINYKSSSQDKPATSHSRNLQHSNCHTPIHNQQAFRIELRAHYHSSQVNWVRTLHANGDGKASSPSPITNDRDNHNARKRRCGKNKISTSNGSSTKLLSLLPLLPRC